MLPVDFATKLRARLSNLVQESGTARDSSGPKHATVAEVIEWHHEGLHLQTAAPRPFEPFGTVQVQSTVSPAYSPPTS